MALIYPCGVARSVGDVIGLKIREAKEAQAAALRICPSKGTNFLYLGGGCSCAKNALSFQRAGASSHWPASSVEADASPQAAVSCEKTLAL